MKQKQGRSLPGDITGAALIDRVVRVDHAGEYGAVRIYQGQLDVLRRRDPASARIVEHMAAQEAVHLKYFEQMITAGKARPSLLHPLWHVAGYALGAATAMMGSQAAMACTVAVEEAIDEHYAKQADRLAAAAPELTATIQKFRDDELSHRDTALAAGASLAPAYGPMKAAIKTGARLAIWLAERF